MNKKVNAKHIIVIIISAIVFLMIIGGGTNENNDKVVTNVAEPAVEFVTLSCGAEFDKTLDCPGISVWERTGPNRGKTTGVLEHNTTVEVLDIRKKGTESYGVETDQTYYLVKYGDLVGWVFEGFVPKPTTGT